MKRFNLNMLLFLSMLMLLSIPTLTMAQDEDDDSSTYNQILTEDGISVFYPDDWTFDVAEDDAIISLFSNEAIAERDADAPFESGDVSIWLTFTPSDYAHLLGLVGDSNEERLTNLVNGLVGLNTDEDSNAQLSASEIEIFEASNDLPEILFVTYSLTDVADGMVLFWDISDDLLGVAIVTTATDELADNQDLIMRMMQNVTFETTIEALRAGGND